MASAMYASARQLRLNLLVNPLQTLFQHGPLHAKADPHVVWRTEESPRYDERARLPRQALDEIRRVADAQIDEGDRARGRLDPPGLRVVADPAAEHATVVVDEPRMRANDRGGALQRAHGEPLARVRHHIVKQCGESPHP